MTVRGGGDPPKPWLSCRCADWARRLGASQPMRMCASWSGSKRSTEYKVAGAISLAVMRAPLDAVIPTTSSLHRARCCQERGTTRRAVDPTQPACRRARRCNGRAFGGRCAASLDIVCARRRRQSAVGAKESLRCGRTKERRVGCGWAQAWACASKQTNLALAEGQKKWPLTTEAPYKVSRTPAGDALTPRTGPVSARNCEDLAKDGQNGFLARIAKSQKVEIACPAGCVGQPSCEEHCALEDEAVGMRRAAQPIEKTLVHKPGEQHIERLRRLAREVEQACTNGCSDIGRPLSNRP